MSAARMRLGDQGRAVAGRVRYMFMACPECGFDQVLAVAPHEMSRGFCCHICFDLTGVLVDMPMRESTAADIPRGNDQRTGSPR